MTALAIITTPACVVVASDGGSYLPDGSLAVTAGKVTMLPEASTVITGRGSMLAHLMVSEQVTTATRRLHLDDIVSFLPPLAVKIMARGTELYGAEHHFSLYAAGWSEARDRPEAWGISSYDGPFAPACMPYPLPECFLVPDGVPQDVGELFGIRMPSTGETQWRHAPDAYATMALCAARVCPGRDREHEHVESVECHSMVGAFIQVTTVTRHTVLSQIVHEWPDVVGRPIDPEVGDPIPKRYRKEATPDDRPAPRPIPGGRPGKRARRRHR